MLLNGFEQIVQVPTRGSNILDLVPCRYLHMLPDAHIIPPLINSDHEAIELTLNYKNYKLNLLNNNVIKYKRNFQKINVESILSYFKNINWIYEFSTVKTVEERYAILLRYLNLSIKMFVPLKLIKIRLNIRTHTHVYLQIPLYKRSLTPIHAHTCIYAHTYT